MSDVCMESKPPRPRWWIVPAAAAFAFVGFIMLPMEVLQAVFAVVAGWVPFLYRVVPSMTVDWLQVCLTAAVFVVFVLGLHHVCRWLARGKASAVEQRWKFRWTAAIGLLILFLFVAGTSMVGIAHQAVWLARSKEAWTESVFRDSFRRADQAKRIAMAARTYGEMRGVPLSGATVDDAGVSLHSWMTEILPFVEESDLYAKVKLDERWDAPVNWPVFMTRVSAYELPRVDHEKAPPESVAADFATNALVIGPGPPLSLDRIPDGASKTLLGGEVTAGRVPWGKPGNWRDPRRGLSSTSPEAFGGPYGGRSTMLIFADGHVAVVEPGIDPRILEAIATPDGGEPVPDRLR